MEYLKEEGKQMDSFEIINRIFMLVWTTAFFVFCVVVGFTYFNRIYPTRYGKKHMELKGKVVGKELFRVRYGRIIKLPVVQFNWKETSYEIADRTHHLYEEFEVDGNRRHYLFQKFEVGDNVIVCYNPSKHQDIAIIKAGTFDSDTIMPWLMFFIAAIGLYICILLELLLLVI